MCNLRPQQNKLYRHSLNALLKCFQHARGYLATAVSYAHTMFVKSTPVVDFISMLCVTYGPSKISSTIIH